MKRKIISIILCLSLIVSLAPAVFAGGESGVIEGTYSYLPTLGILGLSSDVTGTFRYSDDYFTGDGYRFHKDRALASVAFTQASFGKGDVSPEHAYENQRDFLEKCGFEGYDCNYYFKNQSHYNSLAVGGAYKKLADGTTLIAMGTRGGNYYKEWAGNVNDDASGNWLGFQLGADQALEFIRSYIAEHGITGTIRLWMVGYSRTAIITNLTAAAIDDGYDLGNVDLPGENMYVFCFESPEGTDDPNCRDAKYNNIHNIYNPADVVEMVPLHAWGMDHYGEDVLLPAMHTDPDYAAHSVEMFKELVKIPLGPFYIVDTFQFLSLDPKRNVPIGDRKITQVEFYPMLAETLAAVVPTREDFLPYIADIQELLSTILGNSKDQWGKALQNLGQDLSSHSLEIVTAGLTGEEPLLDALGNVIFNSLAETGVTAYTLDEIKALLGNLVPLLAALIREDADMILTFIANLVTILNAHFTEIVTAWLRSMPEEYFTVQENGGPAENAYLAPFIDVPLSAWYTDAVKSVYEKGLMTGTSSTTFEPDSTVTRGMVVQILFARAGKPAGAPNAGFSDVKDGAWYADAVNWAKDRGAAGGFEDNTFRPNDAVTREQLAVILKADAGSTSGQKTDLSGFRDADEVSAWAQDAIRWAVGAGLIAGRNDGRIDPRATATRAEVAQIIHNYLK